MDAIYFHSQEDFRAWLEEHHDSASELWLGFYKKASGRGGITPPQALDEALCFGWIDGIRKSVDETRYINRYTPRRKGSNWSQVNIGKMEGLIASGQVHESGRQVFEARDMSAAVLRYSSEAPDAGLSPEQVQEMRQDQSAWAFWSAQPPSYRKIASFWVNSAKREETREKRLATLIEDCANGRRIALVARSNRGGEGPAR